MKVNLTKIVFLFASGLSISILSFMVFLDREPEALMFLNFQTTSILAGVIWEELIFRYILIRFIIKLKIHLLMGIILSSVLFSAFHYNINNSPEAYLGYFVGGVYYSLIWFFFDIRDRKNAILLSFGIGLHYYWNVFQFSILKNFEYEINLKSVFQRFFILGISFLFLLIFKSAHRW